VARAEYIPRPSFQSARRAHESLLFYAIIVIKMSREKDQIAITKYAGPETENVHHVSYDKKKRRRFDQSAGGKTPRQE
jgi:hypothetical protein